jgi:hypothetical protein
MLQQRLEQENCNKTEARTEAWLKQSAMLRNISWRLQGSKWRLLFEPRKKISPYRHDERAQSREQQAKVSCND